jgi:hypothetical protein
MSKIVQKDFPLRGSTTEQGFSGDRTSIYYFYKLNSPFLNSRRSSMHPTQTDLSITRDFNTAGEGTQQSPHDFVRAGFGQRISKADFSRTGDHSAQT